MKNTNEPIENRTRGLSAFSAVTQMQTVLLCFKYLSTIYHYSLRSNTEERISQLLRGISLKSRIETDSTCYGHVGLHIDQYIAIVGVLFCMQ